MVLLITAFAAIVTFTVVHIRECKRENKPIEFKIIKVAIKEHFNVIILILIFTVINFFLLYSIKYFQEVIANDVMWLDDILILGLIGLSLAIVVVSILMIYIQPLSEKRMIAELGEKYKGKDYKYFREILKDIPPAFLLYLYSGKINMSDAIVAILLNLQSKHIIEFKNNHIKMLTTVEMQHERTLIGEINNGYEESKFAKNFEKILLIDLQENGYVCQGDVDKANKTLPVQFFAAGMIIYGIILLMVIGSLGRMYAPRLSLFIFLAYFLVFVGAPIVDKVQSKIKAIAKTDKGIEVNAKLYGLRNYLKDFSILGNAEVKDIYLYNEYIIYAIIFNMKGKLNKECLKIYEEIKNNSFTGHKL